MGKGKKKKKKKRDLTSHWIFIFFFRICFFLKLLRFNRYAALLINKPLDYLILLKKKKKKKKKNECKISPKAYKKEIAQIFVSVFFFFFFFCVLFLQC